MNFYNLELLKEMKKRKKSIDLYKMDLLSCFDFKNDTRSIY